jgi:hypothetical protein
MEKHLAALLLVLSAFCIHGCTRPEGNMDQTAQGGDYTAPSWRQ